jgi:hypothetical protein
MSLSFVTSNRAVGAGLSVILGVAVSSFGVDICDLRVAGSLIIRRLC